MSLVMRELIRVKKLFRLLPYFTTTSGISFVFVATVLLFSYRELSVRHMASEVEGSNQSMARVFGNVIWSNYADYVLRHAPDTARELRLRPESEALDADVRRLTDGLNIIKVKIYRLDGLTVYSSNQEDIGKSKSNNQSFISSAVHGRPASKMDFREKFSGLNGNLNDRHVVESYMPLYGTEGRVEGVIELYTDATDHVARIHADLKVLAIALIASFAFLYVILFLVVKRADKVILEQEEGLIAAVDAAERANRLKSQFLANISHELRTPLNAIIGFSTLIKSQAFGSIGQPKYLEYAAHIQDSGQHLLDLLRDLIDLSTMQTGTSKLQNDEIVIKELVEQCASQVILSASEKKVCLKVEIDKNLGVLHGDRRACRQILLNLLTNAIKFTPAGGAVTLRAGRDADAVKFEVSDTGIGIPKDKVTEVLEPFNRGSEDPYRTTDGWGLGLSIADALVKLQNGRFLLESNVGKGTSAQVYIPASRQAAPLQGQKQPVPQEIAC